MGVVNLLTSITRRLVLFSVVFLWSPLAYMPGKDGAKGEPMACLPTVSRSLVEPNPESTEVVQASVAEHFLIVGLMPGILIRTPFQVWSKLENSTALWEKLKEEAIINGEYAMSTAIFKANYSIATPLLAYRDVDWSDAGWISKRTCNSFLHPSREGSYYGMSIHPLETVFIKTSWAGLPRVRPQETDAYTRWTLHGPSP